MKLNITLASNAEGWDKAVNKQLQTELALNAEVNLTGFVPKNTQQQRDYAQMLNMDLVDAKVLPGFPTTELLSYPPNDLKIDILVMHSSGRDVGRQAQIIRETKNCKWALVVETVSEDMQESEYALQETLCKKADLVMAIGPKVADDYESGVRLHGKETKFFTLTPGILYKYLGACLPAQMIKRPLAFKMFNVLISGSSKYFEVRGCDIAATAIKLLEDPSYRLILVAQPHDDNAELKEVMVKTGLDMAQVTVKKCSGDTESWCRLLCEADILINPSRTEGFGMSGLRAISADLPVLISANTGLGMVLKKLPSGEKHVVDSNDPQVWADKIKDVRAKDSRTRHLESTNLRNEYRSVINWERQCNELVETFSQMVPQGMKMNYLMLLFF